MLWYNIAVQMELKLNGIKFDSLMTFISIVIIIIIYFIYN